MSGGTSALTLFKEEMSHDQMSVRINAVHRIGIIATLLGPEKVKRELLPMIESNISFLLLNLKHQ
jgi:hypothetical protein